MEPARLYGQDLTSTNPAIAAHKNGAHLRRNMAQTVVNTIFVGYKTGLRFQIAGTKDNLDPFQATYTDSSATYANNYIVGSKVANFQGGDADFTQVWYHTYVPLHSIDTTKTVSDIKFVDPNFDGLDDGGGVGQTPDFRLQAASVAASGAVFTDPNIYGGFTGVKNLTNTLENSFVVYPNPATKSTNLSFALVADNKVSVSVYDVLGHLVSNAVNETSFEKGNHSININTSDLSAGIYYISLEVNGSKETKKLIINQ